MIKAVITGCTGKMGTVLTNIIGDRDDMEVVAGISRNPDNSNNPYPVYSNFDDIVEEVDVVIDFSNPSTLKDLLEYGVSKNIPLVIATTGFSPEDIRSIEEASKNIPILYSQNMSLGINLLVSLAKKAALTLGESFDIEIIEKHHNKKVDAPSGTAYMIAEGINESLNNSKSYNFGREGKNELRHKDEIGIHAIRGGTIPGEHSVLFAGLDEVIELKHSALSKNVFAQGGVVAAKFIVNKENRLYSMKDIFDTDE